VTSAQNGQTKIIQGDKFIVLNKGQQVVTDTAQSTIKVTEFDTMGTRIRIENITDSISPPNTRSSLTLIQDAKPDNQGELSWRIGIVLAAVNLLLIGLASANFKPRQAKSAPLLLAIMIFVSYYNFINVGQNWIASGKANFFSTVFLLHGSVTLLTLAWLARRHYRP
jgi:lipopolysaccharide export system permease protein